MPPSSSSSSTKQPSLGRWIAYGALVFVFLLVVGSMFGVLFRSIKRHAGESSLRLFKDGSSQTAGYGIAGGSMAINSISPSIAPTPPMFRDQDAYTMSDTLVPRAEKGTAGLNVAETQPHVIKTGDIMLRVKDVHQSIEYVRTIVTAKNGFVESSSVNDSGQGPRSAWMTIRIPVAAFEGTLAELRQHGVVTLNESTNGQDVTMEFVDLEADLRNARAEEASYLEILKRSGDIEDVLAVTERLADVRGRIERLEGRKRYLENRTDLATISVSLTEETRVELPSRTWKPGEIWREAISDLIVALQNLVNFLIRAAVSIVGLLLPIVILTAIVVWIGWKIFNAIRRRAK